MIVIVIVIVIVMKDIIAHRPLLSEALSLPLAVSHGTQDAHLQAFGPRPP